MNNFKQDSHIIKAWLRQTLKNETNKIFYVKKHNFS